jgi:Iron permease FTR1 family
VSCGFIIYQLASRASAQFCSQCHKSPSDFILAQALRIFLIIMTNLLLLIGAGLFSRSTAAFQTNTFNHIVGGNLDDTGGTGPGSYRVQGNVWHLDCCSPASGQRWSIFNAILGWDNNATSDFTSPELLCAITHHPFHSRNHSVLHLLLASRHRCPRLHEIQRGQFDYGSWKITSDAVTWNIL